MENNLTLIPEWLRKNLFLFNNLLDNKKDYLKKVLHKNLITKIWNKKINFLKSSYSEEILNNPKNYTLFNNILNLVIHCDEKPLSFNNLFLELSDGSIEPVLLNNSLENKLNLLEQYKDSLELQLDLKLKELIKKELKKIQQINWIQISSFHYLDIKNPLDLQGDWKFWINKEELTLNYFEQKVELLEDYLDKINKIELLWLKMKQNNLEDFLIYYKKYFELETLNFESIHNLLNEYIKKLEKNHFNLIEEDDSMNTILDFLNDMSYLKIEDINIWLKNRTEFKKHLLKTYLEDKEEKFEKIDTFVLDYSNFVNLEIEEDKKDKFLESYVKEAFTKLKKENKLYIKAKTSIFENFHYFILNELKNKNSLESIWKIVLELLKEEFDIEIDSNKIEIKIDYCNN